MSVGSTVDRYAEDVHYIGGTIGAAVMLYWGTNMLGYNARPPDPEIVGDAWRQIWFDRMEKTPSWVETWISHQRRDEYWKQGSVCEDYAKITCPVYIVAGWHDSYRDSVLRYVEHGDGPAKGLIGPWGHHTPRTARPDLPSGSCKSASAFTTGI